MEEKKRTKIVLIILGILFLLISSILVGDKEDQIKQELIKNVPTIIDFGSDCYTCTMQKEYLDTLKEKYKDSLNVKKVDIYENTEEAEKYGIKVIPTLIFIDKDGNQVEMHEGLLTYEELEEKLIDLKLISISCSENEGEC